VDEEIQKGVYGFLQELGQALLEVEVQLNSNVRLYECSIPDIVYSRVQIPLSVVQYMPLF